MGPIEDLLRLSSFNVCERLPPSGSKPTLEVDFTRCRLKSEKCYVSFVLLEVQKHSTTEKNIAKREGEWRWGRQDGIDSELSRLPS